MNTDIRLQIKSHPHKVYTRAGDKVEISGLDYGYRKTLIYGYVLRKDKKISHYWQQDGRFKMSKPSPLDLIIKQG